MRTFAQPILPVFQSLAAWLQTLPGVVQVFALPWRTRRDGLGIAPPRVQTTRRHVIVTAATPWRLQDMYLLVQSDMIAATGDRLRQAFSGLPAEVVYGLNDQPLAVNLLAHDGTPRRRLLVLSRGLCIAYETLLSNRPDSTQLNEVEHARHELAGLPGTDRYDLIIGLEQRGLLEPLAGELRLGRAIRHRLYRLDQHDRPANRNCFARYVPITETQQRASRQFKL